MDATCATPKPTNDLGADGNAAVDVPVVSDKCPKCEAKLIDPSGLGWCKSCGYCKSLEEDKARVPMRTAGASKTPSLLGMVEFGQVLAHLPSWAWVLVGGMVVIVVMNVLPAQSVPKEGLVRAVLSTSEIAIGLVLIFVAQFWALFAVGGNDEKLNFKDGVLPGRLWGMAMRKLPETQGQVWLASWGITCILSALLIIGGLPHWMEYLPKSKPAAAAVAVEESDK
jgi:hypothetical protein